MAERVKIRGERFVLSPQSLASIMALFAERRC
jgi:hypothetical protein